MSFRDNGDKEKVQAATDLVRLIGEQVNLRPKGKEFVGLCPFHDDKTPSMQVSPQKQIYKCFSCGAGGDAFSFVMNFHKMEFVESLKYLAERAGIELTPWKPEGAGGPAAEGPSERKRIAAANEKAVGFYRALLKHPEHGAEARAYLERRGVSAAMVETFQLGYAPDRWDGLVTMAREKGWDAAAFDLAQLTRPRKTGDGHFDFLRHRLVFPIFDGLGRPIAFGGRKLREEDEPKYLNSPETPLFHKSSTLYGIHAAKKPIIDARTAVLVEGYTDVIACHQAGASNVVAALGTALTREHVDVLRRLCDRVVLVMDGDAAGQKAADRAIEVFLTGELDVAMAVLPGGQDPDELLKAGGLEAWDAVLESARPALDVLFDLYRRRLDEAPHVKARERTADELIDRLWGLGLAQSRSLTRQDLVRRLGRLLGIAEAEVRDWLGRREPRSSRSLNPPPPTADSDAPPSAGGGENVGAVGVAKGQSGSRLDAVGKAERRLIAALVRHNPLFAATLPDGSGLDEAISPGELSHEPHRWLYQQVYDDLAEGRGVDLAGLSLRLTAEGRDPQRRLLLEADAELDRALPEPDASSEPDHDPTPAHHDALRVVLIDAAQTIIHHHREAHYQQTRQTLMRRGELNPAELRELIEHRKSHPSPARIARI